ncbi:MAG: HNH endonuclease [Mycobacterium sp.]|nr:HNH endonuclease [Mycobacterium sp.]
MEILAALDDLEALWDKLASLKIDALSAGQALAVLDRLEVHRRRQPALEHSLITHLQSQATAKDMGAKSWRAVLAQRLGISGSDAGRRIAEAARLGQRRAVTGERLEPELPATAAAQARGEIGTDHVTVIRDFMDHLPADVDPATRAAAESQLGGLAGGHTPEGLRKVARQLLGYLDQDGTLDDEREHARKRGITLGPQGLDGMSRLTGWITPELRATVDALFAKLAAPGYSKPDDESPCVDDAPSQEQISGDTRSSAQRNHDALQTVCRAMLASGTLGQHNGLPVTVVATTTLAELSAAAGRAYTGGGTQLPIPTLIRMAAAGAHPYLALFHNPREIQLYYGRRRRTASPGQRLVLHALERGCSKPSCIAPPYRCQVHHAERDWQHGGNTDIDELTLACGCDNRLVDDSPTGWTTRKRSSDNRTEWIPPSHLDRHQHRINHYHHPEEILRAAVDEPG